MEWKSAKRNSDGSYVIPDRWLFLHYYEALNILFRFENALRLLVYIILKNQYFDEWDRASFGENSTSISAIAKRRISQAQSFGYLGYETSCPIMHLTSGELVELVTSDSYWPVFKAYFYGNKDVIRTKFLELNTVRNALAHFRPIKTDDLELLKQNTRHTLVGVESALNSFLNCTNTIPTNTDLPWCSDIRSVASEYTKSHVYQSDNEEWVRIAIAFDLPVLTANVIRRSFRSDKVVNLNSRSICEQFPNIRKLVTSITEQAMGRVLGDGERIRVSKIVSMTLGVKAFSDYGERIKDELAMLHRRVSEEAEVISQDELARGTLLEATRLRSASEKVADRSIWRVDHAQLLYPIRPSDPPEYWGDLRIWTDDIVSGAEIYPWMQSHISEEEIPF